VVKFIRIGADHARDVLPPRGDSASAPFTSALQTDQGALRVQLCGRLRVDIGARQVTPILRGRQGRALFAYLVLHRDRGVSRDELITAIWPITVPGDPAAALRTQLSHVRSALGDQALVGRSTIELRLPENAWIDLEAADRAIRVAGQALAAKDWRDAWIHAHITLNVAARPFLADFEAPWVTDVRHDLEELRLRARESVARAGIGIGGSELAGAERSARNLIREAPFRETGYVCLMEALAAAGNQAEALRVYDEVRVLLNGELGAAPGSALRSLHGRLLSEHDS
jgi:SARP family transcriptional regulator, regulator of embCAB operon